MKLPVITQDHLEIYLLFILNTISSKTVFFPSVIIEWLSILKKIIRSSSNSTYNCFNTKGSNQGCLLVLVIFVITKSSTVSWIHLQWQFLH